MNKEKIEICLQDIISYAKDCIIHSSKKDYDYQDECNIYALLNIIQTVYDIQTEIKIK